MLTLFFIPKISQSDKVHIIIPKAYYKDIQKMIDKFVDVDITEV
jgi:hypothetical protein